MTMQTYPLDAADRELVDAAGATIARVYADPRHTVGAAVRVGSNAIFTGVDVETCGYGPCAEPVALGAAIAAGETRFLVIVAVAGPGGKQAVLPPCGNCRQLIRDYAPDAMVILPVNGELRKVRGADLLPHAYRGSPSPAA